MQVDTAEDAEGEVSLSKVNGKTRKQDISYLGIEDEDEYEDESDIDKDAEVKTILFYIRLISRTVFFL